VDEESTRLGHWLSSVLCVPFTALTLFLCEAKDIQASKPKDVFQNKWSKNYDKRPHHRGIIQLENLMCHSTASAVSQSECWSTACGENLTSGPTGNGSRVCWKILISSPRKCPFPWRDLDPYLTYSSLDPPESISKTSSRLVQPILQGSWSLQTDR